jgi:hypothetical protein
MLDTLREKDSSSYPICFIHPKYGDIVIIDVDTYDAPLVKR